MKKGFLYRLKTAHRFNEIQLLSVLALSIFTSLAVYEKSNAPTWFLIISLTIWPSIAWLGNLILGAPE